MRIAAAQKQQLAFMVLLTGVSLAASNMLASASTEHTLTSLPIVTTAGRLKAV
jgi:hypothetical protein